MFLRETKKTTAYMSGISVFSGFAPIKFEAGQVIDGLPPYSAENWLQTLVNADSKTSWDEFSRVDLCCGKPSAR